MTSRASRVERVVDRLHSAALQLLRRVRRQDARLGIGPTGLSALSMLVVRGPCTVSQLADAEQVALPTTSRLVASLERHGLVVRASDPSDRRRTLVRPTSTGRIVMRRGRERRVLDLAERLDRLSPDDIALLERAAEVMEQLHTPLSARPPSGSAPA
jgi:DNA-binding MarR family transcriptional regulator